MTKDEALKLALEGAANYIDVLGGDSRKYRQALAQPEYRAVKTYHEGKPVYVAQQEPVAWRTFDGEGGYEYRAYDGNEQYEQEWEERNPKHKGWVEPLYISLQQRQWVGLTVEEIEAIGKPCEEKDRSIQAWGLFACAIEAKLKEKNTP